MHVVTPGSLAKHTDSKYLGVLVAAKYARNLNEFTREENNEEPLPGDFREKLTTTALESVARGDVEYHLTARRRPSDG
jgi:DNA-directed RNA polymerase omega subunit